jgi:hypothetical protein
MRRVLLSMYELFLKRRTDACRRHIGDTKDETYRVENVGFARTIQTGDGVKRGVPTCDLRSNWVGLEA